MEIIEFLQTNPKLSIIGFGLLVTFFITLVNYFVLDKEKMRDIKASQKAIQEEIKLHRDNPEKVLALNKQMLSHSGDLMRHSFKPMIITSIPILLFMVWLKGIYVDTSIAGSWIWWYIGASVAGSILFRKLFRLP